MSLAEAIRLVWTCLTALGSPVEPDVYIQKAISSDIVGAVNGVGSDSLSSSSRKNVSRNSARSLAFAPATMTARKCGSRGRSESTAAASGAATTAAAARLSANR